MRRNVRCGVNAPVLVNRDGRLGEHERLHVGTHPLCGPSHRGVKYDARLGVLREWRPRLFELLLRALDLRARRMGGALL